MNQVRGAVKPLDNERGIALVIAILLLMVITLFGALGITMSTRELRGAGDKRLDDQRFYEAQTGVTETLLISNDWLTDAFLAAPTATGNTSKTITNLDNGAVVADVEIRNIQNDDPAIAAQNGLPVQPHISEVNDPRFSLGKFQKRRYSATSTTPDERSSIREGVWRVFSK